MTHTIELTVTPAPQWGYICGTSRADTAEQAICRQLEVALKSAISAAAPCSVSVTVEVTRASDADDSSGAFGKPTPRKHKKRRSLPLGPEEHLREKVAQ